jgi:hypothetical protein
MNPEKGSQPKGGEHSLSSSARKEHQPLVEIWLQIWSALGEMIQPLLFGLNTTALILFDHKRFFESADTVRQDLVASRGPLRRFFARRRRLRSLPPAQYLLFGIFASALAGFGFDNSNRFLGLLHQLGVIQLILDYLQQRGGRLAQTITTLQEFSQTPLIAGLQSWLDQDLIAALAELFVTLFVTIVLAYLFYRLIRFSRVDTRLISWKWSYNFWLYVIGLQFFTTALSFILFSFASLSTFQLPSWAPPTFFWINETGLYLLWRFLFPALVLPRVFAGSGLTARHSLMAAIGAHFGLFALGWLATTGFVALIALL